MLLSTRNDSPRQEQDSHPTDRRRGATMMEYLMMISLIVVVCLIGIGYFGEQTNATATSTSNAINKSLKKGN